MSHRIASSSRRAVVTFAAVTAFVAGFAVAGISAASAQDVAAFYKGKSLKLVSGSGVGGGYDQYSRLLARHIGNHIPGNPTLVVQNMPGASGIKGTNWLYNVAPKDGSVLGGTYNNLVIEPLLGDKATQFDPRKFEWIGAMGKQYLTCPVWHTSSIKTIEDVTKHPVRVGTTGATGNSSLFPKMLNTLLGTKFEVISGYTTAGLRVALEQGEIEGICGFSLDTFAASSPEWIQDHKLRFLLQSGLVVTKELPDVPRLSDFVKDPKDLAALNVFDVRDSLGRPHMFPPGTPKYLVTALRNAFDATMTDAKFLAEAKKLHVEIDPMTGAEMEKRILEAYAEPKDVIARAAELWPPAIQKEKK